MIYISARFPRDKKVKPYLVLNQKKGDVWGTETIYWSPFREEEYFQLVVRRLSDTYAVVISSGNRLYSWDVKSLDKNSWFSPITEIEWTNDVRIELFKRYKQQFSIQRTYWKDQKSHDEIIYTCDSLNLIFEALLQREGHLPMYYCEQVIVKMKLNLDTFEITFDEQYQVLVEIVADYIEKEEFKF